MPKLHPIDAVTYAPGLWPRLSDLIAPPYDVLDEASKARLLARSDRNIVAVDLPHLPAKTVGPDATYAAAGERYRQWLAEGTLVRRDKPAVFVYRQTFEAPGTGGTGGAGGARTFRRRGVFANVGVQPFGPSPDGRGGVHPHEQTFSGPKEDRLKLMRATATQLSPIFGLYADEAGTMARWLDGVTASGPPAMTAKTEGDGVTHELWIVDEPAKWATATDTLAAADIFIADGHHRYNTALNYLNELRAGGEPVPEHATRCLFVLVSMQDEGMIVLPTHRVLGGLQGFSFAGLVEAARGVFDIRPFDGTDLAALEAALERAPGHHAMGLVARSESGGLHLAIATTTQADPLAATHGSHSGAWRSLDVAVVQHLLVEKVCARFAGAAGGEPTWKFPHDLLEVEQLVSRPEYQLGVVLRPTPLDAVRQVAAAGELMPQKSTFFYPKLATGLVVNPLK